jgi:DNA-binding NarL/FixJ family response regulator
MSTSTEPKVARSHRFAIFEDHPLVRDALISRLQGHSGPFEVAYSGASTDQALSCLKPGDLDFIILDLDLADGRTPTANIDLLGELECPILIVSAFGDGATIRAAFAAGVSGFVSKSADPEEFNAAVTATLAGETYTSAEAAAAMLEDLTTLVKLSDQERRAMVLYASGLKMGSVARQLGVSESTAREYIRRLRSKYDKAGAPLPTKTAMYQMARKEGLLP